MKERGILMTGEMVRAILDGRKWQTRRVIKPQPPNDYSDNPVLMDNEEPVYWAFGHHHIAPSYEAGMRLWVRETWMPTPETASERASRPYWYRAGIMGREPQGLKWKSARFMPKGAARIWLEITNVRAEPLQQITKRGVHAEGAIMKPWVTPDMPDGVLACDGKAYLSWLSAWVGLWDRINAKRGFAWAKNPWVWVIEFKPLKM